MKFWDTEIIEKEFNFNKNKELLIQNLNELSNMSVEESTLYKKWGEFNDDLHTSPVFRKEWFERYNDTLVAVETTALYGGSSQYNSIPHFKGLGHSSGLVKIKPDDWIYNIWKDYIKEKYPEKYKEAQLKTGPKQNVINLIFKECGIKGNSYFHGYKRGVYFSSIYENGNDYLCGKIEVKDLVMKPKLAEGDDYTIRWWKDKAIKRYTTLHTENRLKDETLFYSNIIGMTWNDCKEKYLKDVGR